MEPNWRDAKGSILGMDSISRAAGFWHRVSETPVFQSETLSSFWQFGLDSVSDKSVITVGITLSESTLYPNESAINMQ